MTAEQDQPLAQFITQSDHFHRRMSFVYKPLDPSRKQIRLMHILPGQFKDEEIRVTLSVVDLDEKPEYDALSYTWESLTPTKTIYLADTPYEVTVNQYAALRRFRLPDAERIIWMDITCINQADVFERNHQVSMMSQIYATSSQTRIWLGEPQPEWSKVTDDEWNDFVARLDSDPEQIRYMKRCARGASAKMVEGFQEIVAKRPYKALSGALCLLKVLGSCTHIRYLPYCSMDQDQRLVHSRAFREAWKMILSLLERPWWTRVWILQEAYLSKTTPLMHVGSQTISILSFTDARRGWLNSGQDWQPDDSYLTRILGPLLPFHEGMTRLSDYGNTLAHLSKDFGSLDFPVGLRLANKRNAGDKRDFVYSVMGLIKSGDRIPINYGLNASEVFSIASWQCFTKWAHGFDMLIRAAGAAAADMPSWAVDWSKLDYSHFPDSDLFETNEGYDPDVTAYYRSAGILRVTGNTIDKIEIVLKDSRDPDLPETDQIQDIIQNWARQLKDMGVLSHADLLANDLGSVMTLFVTIFRETRTGPDGDAARYTPDNSWTEVIDWFRESKRAADLHEEDLEFRVRQEKLSTDFQQAVQGSSLCVTEQKRLCLANESVQAGDLVVHVRGCGVPLALRTTEPFTTQWLDKDHESTGQRTIEPFKIVGPCYLIGYMGSDGARPAEETAIYLV